MSSWQIIRFILEWLPTRFKAALFNLIIRISARCGFQLYHNIYRLPFGLVMKTTSDTNASEAHALRFIESIQGVHAPRLVAYASNAAKAYIIMTWVEGDCCSDIWDTLTSADKSRIVAELRTQFRCLRNQTINRRRAICAASGAPISDPRVPWLREDSEARVIHSTREFFEQVWPGLEWCRHSDTLLPALRPLIEREDVPIVFCHGDTLPKNILLPGGLEKWRSGSAPLCLIDWEFAGWAPQPWEALKATWLVIDPEEDEWYALMKEVFAEEEADLEADWLWRSKSGVTII
ncbi:protein kinase subdomain-containing protein PKL [Dentipellis sp. KUC8613]|nr:protein kinase subdomain-containing protein PKL [Dentipellis sp. KUC8613]